METLRREQIPSILKVIGKEIILIEKYTQNERNHGSKDSGTLKDLKDSGTLKDLIKFLILYSSIVFTDTDSAEREKDYE